MAFGKAKPVYHLGISGSYGGLNLGDEAILQAMVDQLRLLAPMEISVFSRNAADTRERHPVERVIAVRDLTRAEVVPEIERLDLLLLGGGGILYDAEARIYLREVAIAHELGVPVMTYAISAGPLADPAAQQAVRHALNSARLVTVRDRHAGRVLEELGVQRQIAVTADPAFLLAPQDLPAGALEREGLDRHHTLVGMSVREHGAAAPDISEEMYRGLLANAADFMVDRYDADVVFVPLEPNQRDMQHSHAVVSQMLRPQRARVLKGNYSPGQLLTLIGHFDFAVGMRLHFLIFSALQHVPFVALPYSPKVEGLLESLDLAMPPIHLVSAGRLLAHIDHSWDHRRQLRNRLHAAVPSLQERARQTAALTVQILEQDRHQRTAG